MIFAADAVSKKTGKTAFVEIFEDDDVPYILIGDGSIDEKINLSFYVDTPLEPASSASTSSSSSGSNSSSGTCNINASGILILLVLMKAVNKKEK